MKILFIITTLFLVSCASSPKDDFSESLYTYPDKEGRKFFSFVLTLNNAPSKHSSGARKTKGHNEDGVGKGRGRGKGKGPGGRDGSGRDGKSRGVKEKNNRAQSREDIKFRMEVEAHERVSVLIEEKQYCQNGIEIKESLFDNFTYKIKGVCK